MSGVLVGAAVLAAPLALTGQDTRESASGTSQHEVIMPEVNPLTSQGGCRQLKRKYAEAIHELTIAQQYADETFEAWQDCLQP